MFANFTKFCSAIKSGLVVGYEAAFISDELSESTTEPTTIEEAVSPLVIRTGFMCGQIVTRVKNYREITSVSLFFKRLFTIATLSCGIVYSVFAMPVVLVSYAIQSVAKRFS